MERAEATVNKAQRREAEAIAPPRLPVPAKRFETPEAATAALDTLARTGHDHPVDASRLLDPKR